MLSPTPEKIKPGSIEEKLYQRDRESFDLFSVSDPTLKEEVLIPDVRGMTAREAVKIFARQDLRFKLKGSGIVVKQIPEPNSRVNNDELCIIECQPL